MLEILTSRELTTSLVLNNWAQVSESEVKIISSVLFLRFSIFQRVLNYRADTNLLIKTLKVLYCIVVLGPQ